MKNLTDKEKWQILVQMQDPPASESKEPPADKNELGLSYLAETVLQLPSDSAAEFLKSFPEDLQKEIIQSLPEEKSKAILEIFSYPPESVGAVMAKESMTLRQDATVGQAIDALHQVPVLQRGKAPYVYVLDEESQPVGVIKASDLLFHFKHEQVKDMMKTPVESVPAGATQEFASRLFQNKKFLAVPVTDQRGKFTGVISASSMIQGLREQADRDIAKMVGTSAEELKSPTVFKILKLRMPWLFVNIVSGLLCAFISGIFEAGMEAITVLFLFVPVVLGLSESIGIQGATIVVRNLSVAKIHFKDLGALFLKEISVGIVVGLVCGFVVGSAVYVWKHDWVLGAAISISLNVAITVSALVGLMLPLVFKSCRIDPAIASGPLVLALCDIQTLLVYFTLAGRIISA